MEDVVWCWSDNDPDVIFIFRVSGQEVKVNLNKLREKAVTHEGVLFFPEETALLIQLTKELKEIK